MRGILRVISPTSISQRHRVLVMRIAPTPSLIVDILGGAQPLVIDSFNTILHADETCPCVAYTGESESEYVNSWANLLWLQALLRKQGELPETQANVVREPLSLTGPVVVLYGDEEFIEAVRLLRFERVLSN